MRLDDIKQWTSLDRYEEIERRAEDSDIRRRRTSQPSASEDGT